MSFVLGLIISLLLLIVLNGIEITVVFMSYAVIWNF